LNLGAVIVCSSGDQFQDPVEIAFLPDVEVNMGDWGGAEGKVMMEDGWTRYLICLVCNVNHRNHVHSRFNSVNISNKTLAAPVWCFLSKSWLSEANRIFKRLQITSNFEDHSTFFNPS
jgi:hypothetical protein